MTIWGLVATSSVGLAATRGIRAKVTTLAPWLALSVGVIVGAQLGAWLSQRLRSEHIHQLLSAGLVLLSARLILSLVL